MSEQKISQQINMKRVSASDKQILDCKAEVWARVNGQAIETAATPLANQPSPYIKATFDEKKIGSVKEISIKALHNGKSVFFYLAWESKTPNYEIGDVETFPDAVAVLLPFKDHEKTQIKEMGSKDYPTNSWYWRPDFEEKPKNQVAHGLSTSLYTEKTSIVSVSEWKGGVWQVVMGRPMKVKEEAVNLIPGLKTAIGIAVWEGGNGERGGVKAFSKEWRGLLIDA
jgi:DMSO reductase family type II enzyme heme b subunit